MLRSLPLAVYLYLGFVPRSLPLAVYLYLGVVLRSLPLAVYLYLGFVPRSLPLAVYLYLGFVPRSLPLAVYLYLCVVLRSLPLAVLVPGCCAKKLTTGCTCDPPQLLGERELSELVQGVYFAILDKVCFEHFNTALEIGQNGTSALKSYRWNDSIFHTALFFFFLASTVLFDCVVMCVVLYIMHIRSHISRVSM